MTAQKDFSAAKIKQRLGFDNCQLVRKRMKSVKMKLIPTRLKINITKRLQPLC